MIPSRSLLLGSVSALVSVSTVALSATTASGDPVDIQQLAKLAPTKGRADDEFGVSVDIWNGLAIVGSWRSDVGNANTGAAYLYQAENGAWEQLVRLSASDAAEGDQFGVAVAASDGRVAVGARKGPLASIINPLVGSVYIFEQSGAKASNWNEVAVLTGSDSEPEDFFGTTLAISDDTVVVGARNDDGHGSAFVFENQDGMWQEVAKLTASDVSSDFGSSVSIDGNRIVIGARGDDQLGPNVGAAYVFDKRDTGWTEVAKLTAQDALPNDRFGFSVDVDGDKVIVGAIGEEFRIGDNDEILTDQGAAYVFRQTGGAWQQTAKLVSNDHDTNNFFGWSVSLSDSVAVIGARNNDKNGISDTGAAYVYDLSNDAAREVTQLLPDDAAVGDQFGVSAGLSGTTAILGAWKADESAFNSGSVYIYAVPEPSSILLSLIAVAWLLGSGLRHAKRTGDSV